MIRDDSCTTVCMSKACIYNKNLKCSLLTVVDNYGRFCKFHKTELEVLEAQKKTEKRLRELYSKPYGKRILQQIFEKYPETTDNPALYDIADDISEYGEAYAHDWAKAKQY